MTPGLVRRRLKYHRFVYGYPVDVPLPITETGYRPHFIAAAAITAADLDIWLDAQHQAPEWRQRGQVARQFSPL